MNSKNNSANNQMKPNILFLIIDSLRADKVSGPDKNSITTTLDFVKENGVLFDHTISSSDGTILSYAGLFSGKHPFKTGMRNQKLTRLCDTTSYLEILKKKSKNALILNMRWNVLRYLSFERIKNFIVKT